MDTKNSTLLRSYVPKDRLFVAESGVKGYEDVLPLKETGVDAVLIGEALMRAENKKEMLAAMRGKV